MPRYQQVLRQLVVYRCTCQAHPAKVLLFVTAVTSTGS
jgi:hypothetical protein